MGEGWDGSFNRKNNLLQVEKGGGGIYDKTMICDLICVTDRINGGKEFITKLIDSSQK